MGAIWLFRLVAATLFLVVCSQGEAQADSDCKFPHFRFANEGVVPVDIWVRKGTGCKFHFESTGSIFGVVGILASTVTLRPKNGLLGKNTIRIYVYKPNDDFVGADEFELKIRYNRDDNTGEHSTLLHVNVTVSP